MILVMRGISELRRGRSIQSRAKRSKLRRRQPRYAGKTIRSEFKAPPRTPRPTQPYLGTDAIDVSGAEGARLTDGAGFLLGGRQLEADGQIARQQAEADGDPIGMEPV